MMTILLYLGEVILISGLLYGYYRCCLRNAVFHSFNRRYLLSIPLISLVLPVLPVPDLPVRGLLGQGGAANPLWVVHAVTAGHWGEAVPEAILSGSWRTLLSAQNLVWGIYLAALGWLLAGLVRSLRYIRRIRHRYPQVTLADIGTLTLLYPPALEGIRVYSTEEPGAPFSFFKEIFWKRLLDPGSAAGRQIFRHELYHVRQRHTADIVYLEVLRILFWFNPFFHFLVQEIKSTHEFMADAHAADGSDRHAYAELLVWQTFTHPPTLAHSFFNNHLKRRIMMLTRVKNNPPGYLSRILILPVFLLLVCAFAVRPPKKNLSAGAHPLSKTLTVVIDAGHGGSDAGTISAGGIEEKGLNLAIARKIRQFSAAYNVNVLMTRDADVMPGNKSTKEAGLHYRAEFADEHKADLFVSVHVNNAPDTARGIQVYLSSVDNAYLQKSSKLGSAMIEAMSSTFASGNLMRRSEGIYILQAVKMPAILIECGNLENPEDLAFITQSDNQEKIAKDILQGIVNYEMAAEAADSAR